MSIERINALFSGRDRPSSRFAGPCVPSSRYVAAHIAVSPDSYPLNGPESGAAAVNLLDGPQLSLRSTKDPMAGADIRSNGGRITIMSDPQLELIDKLSAEISGCESDVVTEIFSSNPTPSGLQAVAEQAARFAEATTHEFADPTFKVACKAGCNWCCYQTVRVSPPEVFRIVRSIRSMPHVDQEKLVSRLRDLDKLTHGKSSKERAKLRRACAFLKDELCSIYSARPLACAEFSSADVRDCKKGYRKGFQKVMITREGSRTVAYKAVQRGLIAGLAQALPKAETAVFELTAAVLAALDYPNSETAWLEGKPVFAKARMNLG